MRSFIFFALTLGACAGRDVSRGVAGIATGGCPVYLDASSVAAMRTSFGSECVTLRNVLVVDRTDSPSAPRLFLQDGGGGAYSAIMAKCDPADAQYPCLPAAFGAMFQLLRGGLVSLSGRYHHSPITGFEEISIESLIDQGEVRPLPPPLALQPADLARDARRTAAWFQRVTVNVAADDPLQLYDLSPPELRNAANSCPQVNGFALIPLSAHAPAAAGCNGASNPPSQNPADPREILVGRAFFRSFTYDGDCACSAPPKILVLPTNHVAGALAGFLTYEIKRGGTVGFQELLPPTKADLPLF